MPSRRGRFSKRRWTAPKNMESPPSSPPGGSRSPQPGPPPIPFRDTSKDPERIFVPTVKLDPSRVRDSRGKKYEPPVYRLSKRDFDPSPSSVTHRTKQASGALRKRVRLD